LKKLFPVSNNHNFYRTDFNDTWTRDLWGFKFRNRNGMKLLDFQV